MDSAAEIPRVTIRLVGGEIEITEPTLPLTQHDRTIDVHTDHDSAVAVVRLDDGMERDVVYVEPGGSARLGFKRSGKVKVGVHVLSARPLGRPGAGPRDHEDDDPHGPTLYAYRHYTAATVIIERDDPDDPTSTPIRVLRNAGNVDVHPPSPHRVKRFESLTWYADIQSGITVCLGSIAQPLASDAAMGHTCSARFVANPGSYSYLIFAGRGARDARYTEHEFELP